MLLRRNEGKEIRVNHDKFQLAEFYPTVRARAPRSQSRKMPGDRLIARREGFPEHNEA